jgi:GH24 family phage-related lysozyme (muramidase)
LRASWRSRRCTDDPATINDAHGGRLTLSAAALVGIVLHEGYTDRAVIPVKGDVPTIGFGTTTGVKLGDTTTPPKALARALTDVQQFEGALKQCVTVPLAQHEYDALVSFSYNVGSRAFCQSTLVRKLNAEDYAGSLCRAAALALLPGQGLRAARQCAPVRRAGHTARGRVPAVHRGGIAMSLIPWPYRLLALACSASP